MFEEELIIAIIITIFVLCLHYYFGVIDLWYMPAIEVLTCIIFYELSKAMYKSYETVDNHSRIQQEARENEVNIITEINTIKNTNIPFKNKNLEKKLTFDKNKEIRKFRNDEKILDNVEITTGKEEEVVSDVSITETEEPVEEIKEVKEIVP
jgi:c-di-AMP phosphodiesterase-like protein